MTNKAKSIQLAEDHIKKDGKHSPIYFSTTWSWDGQYEYNFVYEPKFYAVTLLDDFKRGLVMEAVRKFPEAENTPTIAGTAFKIIEASADHVLSQEVFAFLHELFYEERLPWIEFVEEAGIPRQIRYSLAAYINDKQEKEAEK